MSVRVVSFRCTLKNTQGQVLSTTMNRDVITRRSDPEGALRILADALEELETGERREVALRADQAFGFYDPKLVVTRLCDEIDVSEPVRRGESVTYIKDGKRGQFRVIEVTPESVTLDGNHPLAGLDLIFEIEATETRVATPEELVEAGIEPEKPSFH